jgi:L-amino acid N-acyltransferase YncA
MSTFSIRPATIGDLAAITEIYNHAVLHTVATFDIVEKTIDAQRVWFKKHRGKYPILVAEVNGTVAGWAALTAWSDKPAYAGTAEISLYVQEEFQRRGIGQKLSEAIVEEGRKAGLHTLIAVIADENRTSINLAESLGFKHIGVLKEVGFKFGRLLDVVLMQKIYDQRTFLR